MVKGLRCYKGTSVLGYRLIVPKVEKNFAKGLVLNSNKPKDVRYTQDNYNYSKKLKKVTYNRKRTKQIPKSNEYVFITK